MIDDDTPMPPVVSVQQWQRALDEQIEREKALTRLHDQVNAQRRRLPMVAIAKPYRFEGPAGPCSLFDLFGGRRQLIVYHFMFGPDWRADARAVRGSRTRSVTPRISTPAT